MGEQELVVNKNSPQIEPRETFTKWGFILASVGAAMGMANIWMFPWRLGTCGGAAFLIPYLLFLFGFSIFGLMGEYSLGRFTGHGTVGALESLLAAKGKKRLGTIAAVYTAVAVTGVLTFYSIVQSWILHYLYLAVSGKMFNPEITHYFDTFAGTAATIPWHALSMLIIVAVVMFGIQNGIERVCKIMMPIFYVTMLIMLIRSLTLPGASEGVKFLFIPKWEHLLNPTTWITALGMSYFTLSLGSGNVAYGSYLNPNEDIPDASKKTAAFDVLASMMAALAIIPAVFAFGLNPAAGAPLLFITLPQVFMNMPGGRIFAILFFLIVFFAALSSAIHMIEGPVEGLIHKLNIKRSKATFLVAVLAFVVGISLDTSMARFGTFADLFSILLLPLSAVLIAVILYWVHGADKSLEEINMGAEKPIGTWFVPLMKYIFVPVSVVILIAGFYIGF